MRALNPSLRIRLSLAAAVLFLAAGVIRAQTSPASQQPPAIDARAGEQARPEWPREAVRGAKAMVVSDEALASEAGVEILKRGGNAVDAAVAVAFALAVVQPAAGNIGGGGFMLVGMADGRTGLVDYRETAPAKSARDMYVRADGSLDTEAATIGYRSVAIPGTVAGMELALKTYGTKKFREVMAPAIRLAEQGFPVSEKLARSLRAARPLLQRFSASRRILLKDGALYNAGETLRQPELAATLRRIARGGAREFYRGQTAQELADEMRRMGGLITLDDLAGYQPKIREPLRAKFSVNGAEWDVITTVPPSSGGVVILNVLHMLAPLPVASWDDAQSVHYVAEAMRRAFADRAAFLADTDFAKVPVRGLVDPRYAAERRATIDPQRASSSESVRAGNPAPFDAAFAMPALPAQIAPDYAALEWHVRESARSGHTTHFSVVDAAGNAVANTYTINESYGAGAATSTGFLLNDTMDDFTTQPGIPNKLFGLVQSDANAIAPGKRALSSMTPTILLRNGQLSFVTGSPGGPRIISATLLTILNWMRLGADAQAAINAPRFHHQWMPDVLYVEEKFSSEARRALESCGHAVRTRFQIGQVEAIAIDAKTGERLGAADPRRLGAAIGY